MDEHNYSDHYSKEDNPLYPPVTESHMDSVGIPVGIMAVALILLGTIISSFSG